MPDVRYPDGTEIAPQLELRHHFELYAGVRPIRPLAGLPGPLASPRAAQIVITSYSIHYTKLYELAVYATNGAEFWSMTDQPIRSIDDIKSRKMWALPGVTANVIKGTGSAVVAGPAVQMLEIISKGVVDGYTGVPYSSVTQFKLKDYTKSGTIFKRKIFTPTFSFFVHEKKWNRNNFV